MIDFTRQQETQRLLSEPAPGISAQPQEDNLRHFSVMIRGPQDSPYEGGVFELELFLPEEYPMAAPKVCITASAVARVLSSGAVRRAMKNLSPSSLECLLPSLSLSFSLSLSPSLTHTHTHLEEG